MALNGAISKMIFIVGHHNTGKTTTAEYLGKFGFLHIETSEIVRRKHLELAPDTDFYSWAKERGSLFDDFILAEVLRARSMIETSPDGLQDIVITGHRQLSGINRIREAVQPLPNRRHTILYLDAPFELLFERQRGRVDRPCGDYGEFISKYIGFDVDMGIEQLKEAADTIICTACPMEEALVSAQAFLIKEGFQLPRVESNQRSEEHKTGRKEAF